MEGLRGKRSSLDCRRVSNRPRMRESYWIPGMRASSRTRVLYSIPGSSVRIRSAMSRIDLKTLVYGSDGIIYSAIAVSSDVSIHDFSSALTVEMTEASDSDLVGFSWYRSGQSEWSELNDQVPRIIGERGEASRRLEEPRRALATLGYLVRH